MNREHAAGLRAQYVSDMGQPVSGVVVHA
jgi:hypothetical protein